MPETLNLIAIPAGGTAETLSLSLVVGPRLGPQPRLGDYPTMRHWTRQLAVAPPRILLRFGAAQVEAEPDLAALRPELWDALFQDETPVTPFRTEDAGNRVVISYDPIAAEAMLRGLYQATTVAAPDAPPPAQGLGDWMLENGLRPMSEAELLRRRYLVAERGPQWSGRPGVAPADRRRDAAAAGLARPAVDRETLADFQLFHRMPQPAEDAPAFVPQTPEARAAAFDFHRAVTALSSHPTLLRALGLVLDVRVPADAVPAGVGLVAVERLALTRGGEIALLAPQVAYWLDRNGAEAPGFAAFSLDGTIRQGFLTLPPEVFCLLDLDTDGSLAKLVGLGGQLHGAARTPTADGALPALRSTGLAVAMSGRGPETVRRLRRAAELGKALDQAPGQAVLLAEDLVRGWRMDVRLERRGRWQSLHRRIATYRFGEDGGAGLTVEEEGFAQFAAASPAPDPGRQDPPGLPPVETDLYVPGVLSRWTGWSLSAPRPGRPLNRNDPHAPLDADPSEDEILAGLPMRSRFRVAPGTLPPLRFGERYRVRLRVVDLAGNSPAPADPGPDADGLPVVLPAGAAARAHLRHEPVPPPLLVLREIPDRGRPALDRLVIHSENTDEAADAVPTAEVAERHVAPPRCSVDLAERHGMLDGPGGGLRATPADFAAIVARDDAALPVIQMGAPPTTLPQVPGARLLVDWHPDPLARAAAIRFAPGVRPGQVLFAGDAGLATLLEDQEAEAGPVVIVGFGDAWPDRQAFRIALAEGERPPAWDPGERLLTLFLPKGTQAECRLSSVLGEADLPIMAVWDWQRRFLEDAAEQVVALDQPWLPAALQSGTVLAGRLLRLALEGAQWALTPPVPLHLIHASQQPMRRPAFLCPDGPRLWRDPALLLSRQARTGDLLLALRRPGATEALLVGELGIHLPSTGEVQLRAAWTEVEDAAADSPDGIRRRDTAALLVPLRLAAAPGLVLAPDAAGTALGVTQGSDRLSLRASREPEDPGSAPAAPGQQFGDTRHRRVTYTAIAASRFSGDFAQGDDPPDAGLVFTREGPGVTIGVPSSARPPAPAIVQALPSFAWRRERSGTLASSLRRGHGIRVYLSPPWFASGEGELVGVLLLGAEEAPPSAVQRRDELAGRVTEWGHDPLRQPTGRLPAMPRLADFPDAVATARIRLPELGYRSLDVAGHAVQFDAGRKLWFTDIPIAPTAAYAPFVSLALVRFQPDSIPGVEVSPPSHAAILQIAPDRSALLIADPDLPRLWRLTVSGVAPRAPWRNRVEVAVEERRPEIGGDLGWQPAAPGAVLVTETADAPSGPAALFQGIVEFRRSPEPGRYRLVIREWETWDADPPTLPQRILLPPILLGGGESPRGQATIGLSPRPDRPAKLAALVRAATAPARRGFVGTEAVLDGGIRLINPTRRRLVYAEYMAIEPRPAPADPTPAILDRGESPGDAAEAPPAAALPPDPDWAPDPGPETPGLVDWLGVPPLDPGDPVVGEVKLAQAMLNGLGLPAAPLAVDGVLGPLTAAALDAFRAANGLDAGAGLDAEGWTALALAAPLPRLEPGIGLPVMRGPPVALVQRLLNASAAAPIAEDGAFGPETAGRVAAVQQQAGLDATGIVDAATWALLAEGFLQLLPSGVEQVEFRFDRAAWQAGDPCVTVESREAAEGRQWPRSAGGEESWAGRGGTWLEMQDTVGRVLFRRVFGHSLHLGAEVLNEGSSLARAPEPPAEIRLSCLLPLVGAARRLVFFGAPADGAADVLAVFEPW